MVASWLIFHQKCAISLEQTYILATRMSLGAALAGCDSEHQRALHGSCRVLRTGCCSLTGWARKQTSGLLQWQAPSSGSASLITEQET